MTTSAPVTDIIQPNQRLMNRLKQAGFTATKEVISHDLLPGDHALTIVRMQADSVAAVRRRLAANYPWLARTEAVTLDSAGFAAHCKVKK